ncbi:MAG: OB-fold nucleic acid binding domain-containing protein [Luteolibacter sp.]
MLAKCALVSLVLSFFAAAETIDYTVAGEHVGETVTVSGKVSRVSTIPSGMSFVTFGGNGATEFTVVFRPGVADGEKLKAFEGKDAEVTGTIELYKERPQILATAAGDLRLPGGAEPPATPEADPAADPADEMDKSAPSQASSEIIEIPLTPKETKAAGAAPDGSEATSIKLAISLPDGFDAEKPQRVLVVFLDYISGDEMDRAISRYSDVASPAGWMTIAAVGPSLDRDLTIAWHTTITFAALNHLAKDYPAIKTWPLYLAGNGNGAAFAMLTSAALVKEDYNLKGCFLGSVYKPRFYESIKTFRPSDRLMRRVPIFISHGKDDTSVDADKNKQNAKIIEDSDFKEVRIDSYDGDKYMNPESLARTLKWFEELEKE